MSQQRATYGNLAMILDSIQQESAQTPWFLVLMGAKVARFQEMNRQHIVKLNTTMNDLIEKNVMLNDKKMPEVILVNNKPKYKFWSEQHEKDYMEAHEKFMKREIVLEI